MKQWTDKCISKAGNTLFPSSTPSHNYQDSPQRSSTLSVLLGCRRWCRCISEYPITANQTPTTFFLSSLPSGNGSARCPMNQADTLTTSPAPASEKLCMTFCFFDLIYCLIFLILCGHRRGVRPQVLVIPTWGLMTGLVLVGFCGVCAPGPQRTSCSQVPDSVLTPLLPAQGNIHKWK